MIETILTMADARDILNRWHEGCGPDVLTPVDVNESLFSTGAHVMPLIVDGGDNTLPTIHDIPAEGLHHMGWGAFEADTAGYSITFRAAEAYQLPDTIGSYCFVVIHSGFENFCTAIGYDAKDVYEKLVLLAEGDQA